MKHILVLIGLVAFGTSTKAQSILSSVINYDQVTGLISLNEEYLSPSFNFDTEKFQMGSVVERRDSSHHWNWNIKGEKWDFTNRIFYTTDVDGHITRTLEKVWDGEKWENKYMDSIAYDASYNEIFDNRQLWDGANWYNWVRTIITYDNNNNQSEVLIQGWDDTLWVNTFILRYTYNADNEIVNVLSGTWRSNEWDYTSRGLYEYDFENNVHIIVNQRFESGVWADYSRIVYDYNSDQKLASCTNQKAIAGGGWESWYRHIYTYPNNLNTSLTQEYVSGLWINQSQGFLKFNSNQNIISGRNQLWHPKWFNRDSSQYYYTTITGINQVENQSLEIFLYPNPATSSLDIQFADQSPEEMSMEIYSNEGVLQMKSVINTLEKKNFDISQYPPGMYHVVIQNRNGFMAKGFLKM